MSSHGPDEEDQAPTRWARWRGSLRAAWLRGLRTPRLRWALVGLALLLLLPVLFLGAFPVSLVKERIAQHLSATINAPVHIGSIARTPFFSFTPTVELRDVRIAQPDWAGPGDMLRVDAVRARLPLLPALAGRGLRPRAIEANGLSLALVRDEKGRSNWSGRQERKASDAGGEALNLTDLTIRQGRFTLRDARRFLDVRGTLEAGPSDGLAVRAQGRFHDAPVTLSLDGEPIVGRPRNAPYPLRLHLDSPLLTLDARGQTIGALDTSDMTLSIAARAPSLKYLDDIILAGLFGTQPIDLRAQVRRDGHDWLIDRLEGDIGRSRLSGQATIRKREGRSKIDATIAFSQLDFDDLADDAGLAEQRALRARIGPRVIPNTRINLAKVGPTDGEIRFSATRLLFRTPSVFRSLKGVLRLDGKVLRVDDVDATLRDGRMTGRILVDHRTGASPRLDLDLQFRDGRLGALLDAAGRVDAPFGARIALSGRGDTIRTALTQAQGHVGFVAGEGWVSRTAAAVLAQDMGKTIGAVLGDGDARVPLRCIAIGFEARDGRLTAAPFLIETGASRSRGEGTIVLDGEQIALTIGGTARDPSGLPIVDPIRIDGTLSAPALELSSLGKGVGGVLGAVAKSIGSALGLAEKKQGPEVAARGPLDCVAISRTLLETGLPERP